MQQEGLKELLQITLAEAKRSPCVRRKFGAVVFTEYVEDSYSIHNIGFNQRVSSCCDNSCIRENLNLKPGERAEIGAEAHAEQSALVGFTMDYLQGNYSIIIAGYDSSGNMLKGFQSWPCYTCAKLIKHCGIDKVIVPSFTPGEFYQLETDSILRTLEHDFLSLFS